jgi:membrane-bound lytic murein transglycosylase B
MKVSKLHYELSLTVVLFMAIVFTSACATFKPSQDSQKITSFPNTSLSSVSFAREKMSREGINPLFISKIEKRYLKHYTNEERDRIIQLNVLGFLNPGDHSLHFSKRAVKNIKIFIKKYSKTLKNAESAYNVPKEIIASLLWVETRHGKAMGQFDLSSVFFALLQANHPEVARNTLDELNYRKPSSKSSAANYSYTELQNKVAQRLNSKSIWAMEQIKAMESLYTPTKDQNHFPDIISTRGSFAGAFGCSQFIPSSFKKYAVSSKSSKSPNLFDIKDCIFSVANFLRKSGWETQNPKACSDALFEYNRVRDYGEVIVKLAEAAKEHY